MEALLDKFKKVVLKTTTLLPLVDQVHLDQLHWQYEAALEQLDEWRSFFEMQDKKDPMPGFAIEELTYRSELDYRVKKPAKNETRPFDHIRFYVGYPYIEIGKLIVNARNQYIRCVYDYFHTKYTVGINYNLEALIKLPKLSYLDVVEDIRKQFGGLNFNAIAKEQVTAKFREKVGYKSCLKLTNKNFEIENYFYPSNSRFSYNCEYLKALEDAVMFYERGHTDRGILFTHGRFYGEYVDYSSDYELFNSEKLEAIRFYKNNKVTLKFKSAQFAKEFYEYFDLETLKESRW